MGRCRPMQPALLHAVRWRERLIEEGFDAIEAFAAEYPEADRQILKRMIQKARAMQHKHGTPRFLLRYIRDLEEAKQRASEAASIEEAAFDQARVPPTVN
jgi:ribosomal 50S subunit-associated protein YjgA (DUF615 family)